VTRYTYHVTPAEKILKVEKMKTMLLMLVMVALCVGCSPSRRLKRLVAHHPELLRADTITFRDTVAVPGVVADTAVLLHVERGSWDVARDTCHVVRETVRLERGRLEVLVRRVHDTLFIRGKCKADTVVIRRKIPVTRIVVAEPRKPWVLWGVIGLLSMVVFVMIFRVK
jgi:hypothetical protein